MATPRLLPLIGVAVVGVIAINALNGASDLPRLLSSARAMAEALPTGKPAKGAKAEPAKPAADAKPPAPTLPPAPIAAAPAGVCAPGAADLAKSAGLSPGELTILQQLQTRRGQIDQQSKDLDSQAQLVAAAEVKLDAKLKAMADLKAQIEGLLGQADQKTQGEVNRLVVVYSKMNPRLSAPIFTQLDDKVRVPVAAAMKPKDLGGILANMQPVEAKKLTELLAHRFANVQQLADAAKAPAAPAAVPAPPAKAPPAKTAQAKAPAPDGDDANVDDEKPAKPKVKKLAKHTPPKKKAYKAPVAKKPVEEAKAPAGPKPYSEVKDVPAKPAPAAAAAPAKT